MSYKTYKISELFDSASGLSKSRDEFGYGYPFLSFKEVFNNYFLPEKLESLANTTEIERERCSILEGDVFITRTSETQNELGLTSVALSDVPNATFNGFTKRLRKKQDTNVELSNKYLGYYFRSPKFRMQVTGFSTMTTRASLNNSMFEQLTIDLPEINIQKTIGSFLFNLDKKIELNNRMNKNLEQMAQAIFKQWFVDFEFPNEQGEPYKSSGGEMVWCEELGKEIPKGWEVGPVTNLIEINPKRTLKKGTEATYVEMKSIPSFEPRITSWITREVSSGTKFMNGDVLLARITPCLENGKTAYVDILSDNEIGWGSTEFIVIRSKNSKALEYAYILARSEEFRDHAIKNMTGSSGRQRVPESCFENLIVPVHPDELVSRYGEIISPFFSKMKQNGDMNIKLSSLRDTLLPKLMSGEIDVSNIEL